MHWDARTAGIVEQDTHCGLFPIAVCRVYAMLGKSDMNHIAKTRHLLNVEHGLRNMLVRIEMNAQLKSI